MSKLLVLDGRDKLEMWWVEEGYLTDLSSVLLVRLSQSLCGSRRQSALLYTLGSRFDAVHDVTKDLSLGSWKCLLG